MQFCQPHWDDLREAIRKVGLEAWVSESGEAVARAIADQIETGNVTIDNFDPLMDAHFAIASNVASECHRQGDPGLVMILITEPICPLCLANLMCSIDRPMNTDDIRLALAAGKVSGEYDEWLDSAAQSELDRWRKMSAG